MTNATASDLVDPALQRRALDAFVHVFGGVPSLWVQAPGRVNLIGEHTDYNDGFVLPCAIDRHTLIALRPRADRTLRVLAADLAGDQADISPGGATAPPALDIIDLDAEITHHAGRGWTDYVRGMLQALRADGVPLAGADMAIAGNVPQGAGLSSSAALEVAVGQAMKTLQGLGPQVAPDATRVAQLAQLAENRFVGCRCGIMDQLVSARGAAGHAVLIDCRSLAVQPVPLPPDVAVMIVHSRVRRGLVDSAYNERRQQCEAAAAHFGVPALRDLDLSTLEDPRRAAGLAPLVARRARHVVTENARTQAAAAALAVGDLPAMGRWMAESHQSMRDDFEITVPAIDQLVAVLQQAIAVHAQGQGGARMTGGGFGGCVVALLPAAAVAAVRDAVQRQYRSPEGETGSVWVCQAAAGASAWAPGGLSVPAG